ncbi:DUF4296 domain-containing protein [Mucilaginibacter sp.]
MVIFLTACGGKKVPPGIIRQDSMVSLLTDVHIVDGSLYTVSQVPDSVNKYAMGRYARVFQQHRTDSAQFRKSLLYYSKHPDRLDEVYTGVIQNLEEKNTELNKLPATKNAVPAK